MNRRPWPSNKHTCLWCWCSHLQPNTTTRTSEWWSEKKAGDCSLENAGKRPPDDWRRRRRRKEHLFQWFEPWCKTPSLSFSNICTLISQSVSQLSSGTNLTGVGSRTQLTICSVLSLMSSSFWTSPVYLIYLDSLSLSLFLIHLRVGQTELASSSRRQQVDVWSC